jgi:Flp pilus assembly protein TadD
VKRSAAYWRVEELRRPLAEEAARHRIVGVAREPRRPLARAVRVALDRHQHRAGVGAVAVARGARTTTSSAARSAGAAGRAVIPAMLESAPCLPRTRPSTQPTRRTRRVAKWQALVDKNPDNELARYSLGSALYEAGRFGDAEPHFRRALELKDDWVLAYIFRARCLVRLGRASDAKPLLARGRELSIQQHHDAPVEEIDALLAELP